MKAEEHIIAWIESSRPHYDRLLEIERRRHPDAIGAFYSASVLASHALALVISSYAEMISCGDASRDDPYSVGELFEAAKLVAAWELES